VARKHRRGDAEVLMVREDIVPLPPRDDDDEVLTIAKWAAINSIGMRTAERILAGPPEERPVITQVSEHRRGITRRNNRIWQQRRER
jgi:hypothetical protein